MLIVIVIIGILAAALIPRFNNVRETARRTRARIELQQIVTAINLLEMDTGARFGGMPSDTCSANDEFPLNPDDCAG
jgi:type II secretory pathway pseudopilin PulG